MKVVIEFKTQPKVSPGIDVGFRRAMDITCHKAVPVAYLGTSSFRSVVGLGPDSRIPAVITPGMYSPLTHSCDVSRDTSQVHICLKSQMGSESSEESDAFVLCGLLLN